jgi:dTDP-4-amino-4,6-dideoxygalactose transaminase
MTDLQAALGVSQMRRLGEFVASRHVIASRYEQLLSALPVTLPWQHPDGYSALHLYVVRLQPEKITRTHLEVFESLREQGVGVNLHYIPVHTHPYYERMGFAPEDFPYAMLYYAQAISLPMYPGLTPVMQEQVVGALAEALR